MPYYISPPPQNPIGRFISTIIAILILAGTLMLGMAAFLVVAGIGLVAGIIIWLRVLLIKRKLQENGVDAGVRNEPSSSSGHIIDAEYTVISEQTNQDRE